MGIFSLDCFDEFTAKLICSKVAQLIGRAGFTEADRYDLIEEFVLDLLQRRRNFDPNTATWEAFVVVVCKNCYATILERRQAAMRSHKREAGSLNRPTRDPEGTPTELGTTIPEGHQARRTSQHRRSDQDGWDLAEDVGAVLGEMPPMMRRVCEILMRDSKAEAARKLDISRSVLYEILKRIRMRFETAGLRGYLDQFSDNPHGEPLGHQCLRFDAPKTCRPTMRQEVYRYTFLSFVEFTRVEALLMLAVLSTESLHGLSQMRRHATHAIYTDNRSCVIDDSTPVGSDLNRLFTGFINREFGENAFRVERIEPLGSLDAA